MSSERRSRVGHPTRSNHSWPRPAWLVGEARERIFHGPGALDTILALTRGVDIPLVPIDNPLPEVDFERVGPTVGERFPDVVLADQHGAQIDLHEYRAGRRALVVFHRSADW